MPVSDQYGVFRPQLLRRARWLEVGRIAYLIEAGVTVTLGNLKSSSAPVSLGLDADAEIIPAVMLSWRILPQPVSPYKWLEPRDGSDEQ